MKKLLFTMMCLLSCMAVNAKDDGLGLFFAYSMEDNSYNDENIKLEIIGNAVYLTNHLQEVIYLDPKKTFFYEADGGINKTDADVIMSVQPNSRIKIHTFYEGLDKYIYTTRSDANDVALWRVPVTLGGLNCQINHSILDDKGKMVKPRVCPQEEAWVDFIGVVGDLYNEKRENKKSTCASVHLTKDETILTEKVALAYSLNSDYSNAKSIVVSTWVSDVYLADYVVVEGGTKKKDGFGLKKGKYTKIAIKANSPFENLDNDQEASPIRCFAIGFGKGIFALDNIWADKGRVVFEGDK